MNVAAAQRYRNSRVPRRLGYGGAPRGEENKVYLPDLPLIVCTWGLSVEKIPESEMNSPRSGRRDADMPFFLFLFAKSSCVFSKRRLGQDRTMQRTTGAGDCQ